MDDVSAKDKSDTQNRNLWQILLGLVLGISAVANPLGAFYWGYSFIPPLLLGFALYVPRKTRMIGFGFLAAALGLSVFVGTAMLLLIMN